MWAINIAREGNRSDWLGFVGGLLGNALTAFVAAIAVYYAWRGINRQLRVSIVSREEDRIERDLPGLRDALTVADRLLGNLRTPQSFARARQALETSKDAGKGLIYRVRFVPDLPDTDDVTRREINRILSKLYAHTCQVEERTASKSRPLGQPGVRSSPTQAEWDVYSSGVTELSDFAEGLRTRIGRNERALPVLRKEMERYFGVE